MTTCDFHDHFRVRQARLGRGCLDGDLEVLLRSFGNVGTNVTGLFIDEVTCCIKELGLNGDTRFVLISNINVRYLDLPLQTQLAAAFGGEAVGGPGGVPDLFDDDVFDAGDFQ